MNERLDAVDQTARRWASEDRILRHARHLCAENDLDDLAYVERMESAALHGDGAAFLEAVRGLLAELDYPADF